MTSDATLDSAQAEHQDQKPRQGGLGNRLNWLRAGVLGANDGIVSVAGIVVGVAGATTSRSAILIAGVAGLAAGAMSMATGEYVSVGTQRDSELALLDKERRELAEEPDEELAELASLYVERGLTPALARQVAEQLTAHDALAAHAEVELGIDPDDISSPLSAAVASMTAFVSGAVLPLLTILLLGAALRVWVTVAAVTLALAMTGWTSARLGYGGTRAAVVRNILGGLFAMLVTYGIGSLVGAHV